MWWGFNIYIGKKLDLHAAQFYVARKTWFGSTKYFSFILDSSFPLELLTVNQAKGLDHFCFSELYIGRTF